MSQPTGEALLIDHQGRRIEYLRLSVTDLCDLRCVYCMPPEGVPKLRHEDILRFEEILSLVRVAVRLGVSKLRVTGGEPLIRRGIVGFVAALAALPGVRDLALTTNGTQLSRLAGELRAAGLMRVNVSLDSLNPEVFRAITRIGALGSVLQGIEAARAAALPVKLNAVLLGEQSLRELPDFIALGQRLGLEVRFIERMGFDAPTPFVPAREALAVLERSYEVAPLPREALSPHVARYRVAGVNVGFITPMSCAFCGTCNKLRLTPEGELRACLAAPAAVDVRAVLRRDHEEAELEQALRAVVQLKPSTGPWTAPAEMWRVGG